MNNPVLQGSSNPLSLGNILVPTHYFNLLFHHSPLPSHPTACRSLDTPCLFPTAGSLHELLFLPTYLSLNYLFHWWMKSCSCFNTQLNHHVLLMVNKANGCLLWGPPAGFSSLRPPPPPILPQVIVFYPQKVARQLALLWQVVARVVFSSA